MSSVSIEELTAATVGQTAPRLFLETVRNHPTAPALRSRRGQESGAWEMWTYTGYAERTAAAAAGLAAAGLEAGERLVLLMRNRPDFHWLDLAAQFLRVTPVSLYQSSSVDELTFLVDHAEARVAIVENEGFLRSLLAAWPKLPHLERIYVLEPPPGPLPEGVLAAAELYLFGQADLQALAAEVDVSDVATLIYTSGTTGPPKGVMITQGNVVYTVEQLRRCLDRDDLAGKRVVSYLPMAHVAERMTSHYQGLVHGLDVYCCPDPALLAPYLREVHPQLLFGVPRIWEKLRNGVLSALTPTPDRLARFEQAVEQALLIKAAERAGTATDHQRETWAQLDQLAFSGARALLGLDAVEIAISGAAPISRTVLEWFEAIGVPLSEIYGLSETSGPLTWDPGHPRPGFVGRAIPGCEVMIAADGEVCCRGGNVFQGYFKRPDLTAEVVIDGWFHTGDIGELDPEGYLRIVDRKKELIITSGGKNISPANLEAALGSIPLVGLAAAIGDNRKFVTALLTLDPDAVAAWAARHHRTGAAIAQLARDPELIRDIAAGVAGVNRQFARVERIKTFTVVGETWLPGSDVLTPTSKLKRRGIAQRYAADIEAMYPESDTAAVAAPARSPDATPLDDSLPIPPAGDLPPAEPTEQAQQTERAQQAEDELLTDAEPDEAAWSNSAPFDEEFELDDEPATEWEDEPRWFRRWWWVILAAAVMSGLITTLVITLTTDTGPNTPPTPTLAPLTTPPPTTVAPTTAAPTTTTAVATTTEAATTVPIPTDLLAAVNKAANLTTFAKAVKAAGLQNEFTTTTATTLFAPTDDAFAKLPPLQLQALLADKVALALVLRHHVVDGTIMVEDLQDGPLVAHDGTPINVTAVEDLSLDGARIVDTDITTANGVLHTIDTVLLPPGFDLSALGSSVTTTTVSGLTGVGTDFSVPFAAGSGLLDSVGREAVQTAAVAIKLLPKDSTVLVTGVTDDRGAPSANDYLGRLRASSVIAALRKAGATNVRYTIATKRETPVEGVDVAKSWRVDLDLP